ncbi:autotransporter outer membrane beta-barrel domain-containing protein [Campylobacter ureolyticus]|uniref:autotransporter outer membrane beta-barrel domain-containing protein n=1 Tax=Campylobacter ureolyticus TaxID=827 RepID=UPI00067DB7AA|nr:autotransporter outer membrane beta-barrel domain-containing protein [Campylobacter ureolyticus]
MSKPKVKLPKELDDAKDILNSLLLSDEGNVNTAIVTTLSLALENDDVVIRDESIKVLTNLVREVKKNKPNVSKPTKTFNIETKRAVNRDMMLNPTKNSPMVTANVMKYLDGTKLASNSDDLRYLIDLIDREIYKNSFNISAIGAKNNESGHSHSLAGGVVSFNKMFDSTLVGGYFSYAKADSNNDVSLKSDLYEVGAYARQYLDNNEFDLSIGYGLGNNKADYNLKLLATNLNYKAKFDSSYLTVGTAYGYKFNVNNNFSIKPFIGLDYFDYTQDSFTASTNHKDVGNLTQTFDKSKFKNLQANLGLEMLYNNKNITLYARPYIARDIYQRNNGMRSYFGSSNYYFMLNEEARKRTSFVFDFGIQTEISRNLFINIGGGIYLNKDDKIYNGQIGFTYRF